MFDKIFKLLKNIQFWTIIGTIAAVISVLIAWPQKPKYLNIKGSVKSDEIINDKSLPLDGDSITIIYVIPIIETFSSTNYFVTLNIPLSLSTADNKPKNNVNIYGYSENYDNRIWQRDRNGFEKVIQGDTYSRFDNSSAAIVDYKSDYSTIDYTFNYLHNNRNYIIPISIRFFNPQMNDEYYKDGAIMDEFEFDLTITESDMTPRIIKINNICIAWLALPEDTRSIPYESVLNHLKQLYSNALVVLANISSIDSKKLSKYEDNIYIYTKYSNRKFEDE